MTGIRTIRLAMVLVGALSLVQTAVALPVKPDLQKILKRSQRTRHFLPAHAGWNSPEMRPPESAPNPELEAHGPAATARPVRAALLAAAVPDPKAVLAIAVIIMLLRAIRHVQEHSPRLGAMPACTATWEEGRRAA